MNKFASRVLTLCLTLIMALTGYVAPVSAAIAACGTPGIVGAARVGVTLTVTASCSNTPTSYAFQWTSSATSGGTYTALHSTSGAANTSSYAVQPSDAGSYIKVSVVATNASGSSTAVTSVAAGPFIFSAEAFIGSATAGTADGTGTAAGLTQVTSITTDGTYLYISDASARTIKRVTSAGVVTTIAGDTNAAAVIADGVGTSATFFSPVGMSFDASRNSLLIKDASIIRELDLSTLQVTSLQNRQTILSVSKSGTTVTLTFAKPHGFYNQSVTVAGLGAPYDGTFTGSTPTTTTMTYNSGVSGTVAAFNPSSATVTGDLGPSRISNQYWGNFKEGFQVGPDGNVYIGRGNYGQTETQMYLLRLVRVSGTIFRFEQLRQYSNAPCGLAFETPTILWMNTCGSLIKTTTNDDWATVTNTLIASGVNTGVFYDPAGVVFWNQSRYITSSGLTQTIFQTPVHDTSMWEMLGNTLYVADDYGTQITKYVGAGSGQLISSVAPSYSVTFNANGGSGSMSAQSSNAAAALTSNAYTLNGSSFAGWNTLQGGGGTAYANGATYSFSSNVTLYAQWTVNAQSPQVVQLVSSAPVIHGISKKRFVAGEKVSLFGINFDTIKTVKFRNQVLELVAKDSGKIEFIIPASTPVGFHDIDIIAETALITAIQFVEVVDAKAVASSTYVKVTGFAANSALLNSNMMSAIKKAVQAVGSSKQLVCNGQTSGLKITSFDLRLAQQRALNACNYAKKMAPSVAVTLRSEPAKGVGSAYRAVELSFKK